MAGRVSKRTVTTIEKLWEYIESNEPFAVHLSDGRSFLIKTPTILALTLHAKAPL